MGRRSVASYNTTYLTAVYGRGNCGVNVARVHRMTKASGRKAGTCNMVGTTRRLNFDTGKMGKGGRTFFRDFRCLMLLVSS